jgi:exodeoxyribonuclease V
MMLDIKLSEDQERARCYILGEFIKGKMVVTLGGFAGTGKTTIINTIARNFREQELGIAFCAFTGKAVDVLRRKIETEVSDSITTIHRLIYKPVIFKGKLVGFRLVDKGDLNIGLIIVDEASMISEKLFNDLKSFHIPILAVGDHGQLPPIKDTFNLMKEPDIKLEKIHRQAENDPIVKLSIIARTKGEISLGNYGDNVKKVKSLKELLDISNPTDYLIMCGMNKTRIGLNTNIRKQLGYSSIPCVGDKIICLKNEEDTGLFNGMIGYITCITDNSNIAYDIDVKMEGDENTISVKALKDQFNSEKTLLDDPRWYKDGNGGKKRYSLFDFGYCITVHKAQGSEAEHVILIEEGRVWMKDIYPKWLYTGITRAKKSLYIVGS